MKIGDDGVEGLGFSIPSNEVSDLVDELVETGKIVRPYAGVGLKSVREIPPHYLEDLPEDVTEGAVVLSIDEESAAAEAGIEVEDVIVSIDGEDIENDSAFRSYLYKNASIDDTVEIESYHKGKLKTVEVKLRSNEDVESYLYTSRQASNKSLESVRFLLNTQNYCIIVQYTTLNYNAITTKCRIMLLPGKC